MTVRRATPAPWLGRVWLVGCLAIVAGCSGGKELASDTVPTDLGTVPLGELPEPLDDPLGGGTGTDSTDSTSTDNTDPPESSAPTSVPELGDDPIADVVDDNRVLLIGDSVLAAISPRHGGIACEVLPDHGWDVEIAAVEDQHIEFGVEVFDDTFGTFAPATTMPVSVSVDTTTPDSTTPDSTTPDTTTPDTEIASDGSPTDFDVIGIFLGNNFDGDFEKFETMYTELLDRAEPRPVIVYTPTPIDDDLGAIGEFVADQAEQRPNVRLVDWAEYSSAEPDLLLAGDGLHLTDDGAGRLVVFTAGALGRYSSTPGTCLPERYTE